MSDHRFPESIAVAVCLTAKAAIAAGHDRFGTVRFALAREHLARLDGPCRAWLAGAYNPATGNLLDGRAYSSSAPVELTTHEVAADAVLDGIRAAFADADQRRAARQAEEDARVDRVLTLDRDGWFGESGEVCYDVRQVVGDPRIAAELARLEPERARRRAAAAERERLERAKREDSERRALEDRQKDEAAARDTHAKARRAFAAYCADTDALARAAADGYEPWDAVVAHVADEIALEGAVVLTDGTAAYDAAAWEDHPAPGPREFAALDRVAAHVKTVRVPSYGLHVRLEKIARGALRAGGPEASLVVVWLTPCDEKGNRLDLGAERAVVLPVVAK